MSDAVESIADRVSDAPYPASAVAWYATLVLAFLYWVSLLDRFIISLLVDPIKRDLGLSDVQFGLLQGYAFSLTFAVFGLLFGALTDRRSRRTVIFAGAAIWALATTACGVAQNFWHIALARVGVGAGEAALNPAATSMLTDLFPRERLTLAMAVYSIGATVGSGTAFMVGGWLVDLVPPTASIVVPLVGEVRSWQLVFFIVGAPGVLLSLIIFTVPEPLRRGQRTLDRARLSWGKSYGELLRFMRTRLRFFVCHYSGFGFASAVVSGCAGWYPAHMSRTFGWSASQIGLLLGLTLVAYGVVGKLFAGRAMDAMFRRGSRDAQLRWYAVCLLVATPFGILATTSDDPWVFLGCLMVFGVLVSPLPACYTTALNLVTPNELRGAGIALFAATSGLIGAGTGPVMIAAVSDYVSDGKGAIGLGMASIIGVCCPLAAGLLALGLGAMREAMEEAECWMGT